MNEKIDLAGSLIGILGLLISAVAGVWRLSGSFYLINFETMVMFNVGVGMMVAACLAKIHALGSR